mgnify:CR=1 FL=1
MAGISNTWNIIKNDDEEEEDGQLPQWAIIVLLNPVVEWAMDYILPLPRRNSMSRG